MVRLRFDSRLLVMPLPDDISVERIGGHDILIQAPAGRSVNQILKDLNITLSQAASAVVDGQTADLEQPLKRGVEVRLLPQIAGGD